MDAATVLAATAAPQPAACWHVQETENLRLLSYAREPLGEETVRQCEALRNQLCEKWLPAPTARWTPKCEIVVHPTAKSYLAEVGPSGKSTLGSSLIKQSHGRISGRRVDVISTRADWITAALPHELTHVVVADAFAGNKVPRWVDEGLAVLADSADKQGLHRRDLERALGGHAAFRLVELFALDEYPAANRWGTFYGQSASVVAFLAGRDSPSRLLDFMKIASERGYETALRDVYHIHSMAELERLWLADASKPQIASTVLVSHRNSGASALDGTARSLAARVD